MRHASTRHSARLQNKPPDTYVQVSTPISQPAYTKRKSPQENSGVEAEAEADESEGARPPEQPRSLPPSKYQLSETNLGIFNERMEARAKKTSTRKRTRSQRSQSSAAASSAIDNTVSSALETATSQRSSSRNAHYRYTYLSGAGVYIHIDPPGNIQAAIDDIFKDEVSENRRAELYSIANDFCEDSKERVQGRTAEGSFVDLFSHTLLNMKINKIAFEYGVDWRAELKPIDRLSARQKAILGNFPIGTNQQEGTAPNPTPDNRPPQQNTMPPPSGPLPKKAEETSRIKTPRPDISVGANVEEFASALCSALSSRGVDGHVVGKMLERLENSTRSSGQGAESLLIATPLKESRLVFPFAVVEGKAYSTGRQIFEAQNQAAVSGASALKIQLSLNKLVEGLSSHVSPPLFFSICTEGPHHELWVHFCLEDDGDTSTFNMKLLMICNSVLLESVKDFIIALEYVLCWGTGKFLDSVVDRLGMVGEDRLGSM
jgi:hypothetical protein